MAKPEDALDPYAKVLGDALAVILGPPRRRSWFERLFGWAFHDGGPVNGS